MIPSVNDDIASPEGFLQEQLCDVLASLFTQVNGYYFENREKTSIQSPSDLASDLVRPKPQRVSSYALGDAHLPPTAPSPGPERGSRFGLNSTNTSTLEKSKAQGHGRQMKFLGDLLLVSGFTNEALKHYTEAATVAKSYSDFLWQAAALDGIGVSIVVLSCYGIPFQIPQIASSTPLAIVGKNEETPPARSEHNLIDFLPNLFSSILGLYNRSTSTLHDQVPPIILAESSLRLSNFLAAIYISGGLNKSALMQCVTGQFHGITGRRKADYPPRAEIAAWAMRAYSETIDSLSLADKVHIYAGLASLLGTVGYLRRRAMFLREIVLALVPALVHARVADAAGKGIHPAATFALSSKANASHSMTQHAGQSLNSLSSLLADICYSYGVPAPGNRDALQQSILGGYGWPEIRSQILRDCITLCEAISDFDGYLKYSTRVLELNACSMSKDEQVRLVATIPRVLAAAKRSGHTDLEMNYWDHWLLRDITIDITQTEIPIKRKTTDLLAAEKGIAEKDPFLYNAFAKQTAILQALVAVQGEPFSANVTLQNPFEYDLEATTISLVTQGAQCHSEVGTVVVKSQNTAVVRITCIPQSSGTIIITGCLIHVAGCRDSFFPIRCQPTKDNLNKWYLDRDGLGKTKHCGLSARWLQPTHQASITTEELTEVKTYTIAVIPAVPTLSYASSAHDTGPSWSILEGEDVNVPITLRNSSNVPINFLVFTYRDSTTSSLEQALASRTKHPHEVYELEFFLYKRRAMKRSVTDYTTTVPPESSEDFSFQLSGKRGFAIGEIVVDYGCLLSRSPTEGTEEPLALWTRRLTIPVRASISGSIDIVYCDFISVTPSEALAEALTRSQTQVDAVFRYIAKAKLSDYCIMFLDLRNMHARDLDAIFKLRNEDAEPFTVSVRLSSNEQMRIFLPFRKAQLSHQELSESIPSLSDRQFVVSSHGNGAAVEELNRHLFWYREALLARLDASWATADSKRTGLIETRSISLNRRLMSMMKAQDVNLSIILPASGGETLKSNGTQEESLCITTDAFFVLSVRMTTDSSTFFRHIPGNLRLQASQATGPALVDLTMSEHFVFIGPQLIHIQDITGRVGELSVQSATTNDTPGTAHKREECNFETQVEACALVAGIYRVTAFLDYTDPITDQGVKTAISNSILVSVIDCELDTNGTKHTSV